MLIARHIQRLPDDFVHAHENSYEIMYCVSGSFWFHYDLPMRDAVTLPREDKSFILIPPNVPHGLRVMQYPYDRYFVQFSENTMDRVLDPAIQQAIFPGMRAPADARAKLAPPKADLCAADARMTAPRFLNIPEIADSVEDILDRMHAASFSVDMDEHWKNVHMHSLLGALFCELYRAYPSFFYQHLEAYTREVLAVKNYIDEHYNENISIASLAARSYISASYLSKCFHKQLGMSPRQYLTQTRLAMAQKLLCSTQMTVQAISDQTGFGDVNFFIHTFKAQYGQSPKQYQKEILRLNN